MEQEICPKCDHALDQGRLVQSGSDFLGYVSDKQTGMLRRATNITSARACTNCGYTELYLDPEELKKHLK
jgi:predicted nucleic-acid-binding Zn-ribbon protein